MAGHKHFQVLLLWNDSDVCLELALVNILYYFTDTKYYRTNKILAFGLISISLPSSFFSSLWYSQSIIKS